VSYVLIALLLDDECFLAARHRRRWPRV